MASHEYVHGYSERENVRLCDQANTLAELLHGDTRYPLGSDVLEAGCGVGAQTLILAQNSPQASFTSIDISPVSIEQARTAVARAGFSNVEFETADLFDLPYGPDRFDHVFVCFVLEHLEGPCGGPPQPEIRAQAGWDHHGHRGGTTDRRTSIPTVHGHAARCSA